MIACAVADEPMVRVSLNQHELEARWNGQPTPEPIAVPAGGADFDDPRSIAALVLSAAPARAIVYPSEQYFYYTFELDGRRVSGNLRFTDVDDSILHIGYFDADDSRHLRYAALDADDGVAVTRRGRHVTVRLDGSERIFTLDDAVFGREDDIAFEPGEVYVSGVLDESGHALHLLFHEERSAFYFVRQAGMPTPGALQPLDWPSHADQSSSSGLVLLRCTASRFVFLRDEQLGRDVLVAVDVQQIRRNTPFDGPFDQVPPRLPIRDKLEAAYPYVKSGAGIDEHGVFLGIEGRRVAISPYAEYATPDDLLEHLDRTIDLEATGIDRWLAAVLEDKRTFHLTPAGMAASGIDRTYSHDAPVSRSWPIDHGVASSFASPTQGR